MGTLEGELRYFKGEIKKYTDALDDVELFVKPILTLLGREGIPIENLNLYSYSASIYLPEDIRLPKKLVDEICYILLIDDVDSIRMNVSNGYRTHTFYTEAAKRLLNVRIDNGKGTCRVRKITTTEEKLRKETTVKYEPIGDCPEFDED